MMTFSTPLSEDLSMMVFSAGIRDSQPSRPKRFSADHFFCRNSSNLHQQRLRPGHAPLRRRGPPSGGAYLVERIMRASSVRFSSRVNCMTPGDSNFCRIH